VSSGMSKREGNSRALGATWSKSDETGGPGAIKILGSVATNIMKREIQELFRQILYWPALPSPGSLRCATSARHVAAGNPGTKSQGPFITRLGTHSFSDFPSPEKRNNLK